MKFIHAADIHLDSPLIGLQQYEGAPVDEIRGATREALRNLVRLALEEEVAFVLVAGDLYDGNWKDYNTGLFFASQMSMLREAGIRVFIVAGNHDAASQITKHLRMPENVKVLSHKRPETIILEDHGIAIHGQSFHSSAVTEDLSAGYPEPILQLFNIGLLHTCAEGREGHERYAPCSVDSLVAKNYDYWALGHVHKFEVLRDDPWIVFPGNLQGRHVRETGSKGCILATMEDGKVSSAVHHELDILRWAVSRVDVSGAATGEEVVEPAMRALGRELAENNGRPLAARVEISGSCRAHGDLSSNPDRWINEIRSAATDVSNGKIWVEKVKFETQTEINLHEAGERNDALGGLLRTISDLETNDQDLTELMAEFDDLRQKLPPELRTGEEAIDLESTDTCRRAIEDVKQLLVVRTVSKEDPQ